MEKNKIKRRRRKRSKRHYFTQVHEDAIVLYAKSDCIKERTQLYVDLIQPAFNEMVDKIVFTFKLRNAVIVNINSFSEFIICFSCTVFKLIFLLNLVILFFFFV